MTTVQACGDSARNVLCCPVSGLDADEVLDAHPVAQAVSDFFTGNREYANLPRKFKLSVTGCREDCAQAEINDVGMLPARLEDGVLHGPDAVRVSLPYLAREDQPDVGERLSPRLECHARS